MKRRFGELSVSPAVVSVDGGAEQIAVTSALEARRVPREPVDGDGGRCGRRGGVGNRTRRSPTSR